MYFPDGLTNKTFSGVVCVPGKREGGEWGQVMFNLHLAIPKGKGNVPPFMIAYKPLHVPNQAWRSKGMATSRKGQDSHG